METGEINTTDKPYMDLKCTGTGQMTPVHNSRKLDNTTGSNEPYHTNLTDVMGQVWSGGIVKLRESAPGGANRFAYVVTNEWNYTRIYSDTVTSDKCELNIIDNSTTPYFAGGDYPSTYEITTSSWTNDYVVYFYLYDLGLSGGEYVGVTNRYWANQNQLDHYNCTSKYSAEYSDTDVSHIYGSSFTTGGYGTNTFTEINVPAGTYEVFLFNSTVGLREFYGGVMFITPSHNGEVKLAWLNKDYFTIYDVYHSPTNPQGNMSVDVHFTTTQTATSRLFYRYAPVSNLSNVSTWSMIYDGANVSSHKLTINNTKIIDGYFYQYYVEGNNSGVVVNATNNNLYYNFTVGYLVAVPTIPDSYMDNATSQFARDMGISQIEVYQMLAVIILLIIVISSMAVTHSPLLGVVVGALGIVVFSLMGWLPSYLLIIVMLITALSLYKVLKGGFS